MNFFINFSNNFPFFGLLFSIILLLGLYQIGHLILKIRYIKNITETVSNAKYQKILFAVNFVLLVFYPLILYLPNLYYIPFLSITIFTFGLFAVFKILKRYKNFFHKFNIIHFYEYIIYFIFFALFLLSLSPNTHGDSLGYHFIVAQELLFNGSYSTQLLNFDALLSGSGEIIIAIGLFFGSEQFGNLVQFSGLVSIFGIIKKIHDKKKYYYILLILTSPIILFLCSTAKPQLFHICSSAFVFSLYFLGNDMNLSINERRLKVLISLIFLLSSVNAKLSFLISSSLLGTYIFYYSIKNNEIKFFIFISLVAVILFYLPIIFWRYLNFGGYFYQYFLSPLPIHILGFEEFQRYLFRYGRQINFYNIFVPKNFNEFSTSIGIGFFYLFLLNLKNFYSRITFIMVIVYLLIIYKFAQFTGRSFLEPLIWIIIIIARYGTSIEIKFFEYACKAQAIVVTLGILYGVCSIFPGSLSENFRDIVLRNNASGYSLFQWANSKLTNKDAVISIHKSISLGNSNYISANFSTWVDFNNPKSKIYTDEILSKKPKYLLTFGFQKEKPWLLNFENCVDELVHYKDNVGKFEARNPFNRGNSYHGFIYKFKSYDFPNCMKK